MKAKVYFTKEITPEKVVEMYSGSWCGIAWKGSCKGPFRRKRNQNFLRPEFWRPMVEKVHERL